MANMWLYPDAHPETSSVDGYVLHTQNLWTGVSWATLLAGAGTGADDASFTLRAYAIPGNGANKFITVGKGILTFSLATLVSDDIITAATLRLLGNQKDNSCGGSPSVNIFGASPASPIALVPADYTQVDTVPLCDSPITYAAFQAAGNNDFILNNHAISLLNLNKGGIIGLSFREVNYEIAGVAPPWVAASFSYLFDVRSIEGLQYSPKLIVTYTPAVDRMDTVKDIVTLEALRNIEMSAMGRVYVDESGNLKYESRYARNP